MTRIRGKHGGLPCLHSLIVPYISQATLLTKGKTGVSLCSPLSVRQVYLTETGLSVVESLGLLSGRDLSIPVRNSSANSHLNMKIKMKGHNTEKDAGETPLNTSKPKKSPTEGKQRTALI